jgi:hypothetical protein
MNRYSFKTVKRCGARWQQSTLQLWRGEGDNRFLWQESYSPLFPTQYRYFSLQDIQSEKNQVPGSLHMSFTLVALKGQCHEMVG